MSDEKYEKQESYHAYIMRKYRELKELDEKYEEQKCQHTQ